jgi:hypothetical protein
LFVSKYSDEALVSRRGGFLWRPLAGRRLASHVILGPSGRRSMAVAAAARVIHGWDTSRTGARQLR